MYNKRQIIILVSYYGATGHIEHTQSNLNTGKGEEENSKSYGDTDQHFHEDKDSRSLWRSLYSRRSHWILDCTWGDISFGLFANCLVGRVGRRLQACACVRAIVILLG